VKSLLVHVPTRQRIRRLTRPALLGTLRRTTPLSDRWGLDRGLPVDRYYIEAFLRSEQSVIRGRVLEIRDAGYTHKFGADAVRRSDVLDIDPGNPCATIVADLAAADVIPDNTFDCFIFTQTLQLIRDVPSALAHARRILRPGGVLLVTLPALCRIERANASTDYWRFTAPGARALFADVFGESHIDVRSYGNVLSAIAFLSGMATEELSASELEAFDPHYPLIIAVRATRSL